MGFDYIEGGYPLSNEKDVAFFEQVKYLGLKHATPCAFGMTRRKGIEAYNDPGMVALLKSEAPVCTIVGKTWDFHVEHVLRVSLEENLSMIHDSVGYLASSGRRVFYDAEHFFDGYKANPEHAIATIKAAADAGAEAIALCDTNGGSMPHEVEELVKIAAEAVGPRPQPSPTSTPLTSRWSAPSSGPRTRAVRRWSSRWICNCWGSATRT